MDRKLNRVGRLTARATIVGLMLVWIGPLFLVASNDAQEPPIGVYRGTVVDADSQKPLPARVYLRGEDGKWYLVESEAGSAVPYRKEPPNLPDSCEVHTTVSAHPFIAKVPPGKYELRIEHGKEYLPLVRTIEVGSDSQSEILPLQRWINMAQRGWYSGDTHVHRSLDELPNVMIAEDLNVALPLTFWVRDSGQSPKEANVPASDIASGQILIDDQHVIHVTNTEYEIFQIDGKPRTLGAVFVLNHQEPLDLKAPPVGPIAEKARMEGALLDLDKHSWPWSLMIVPIMEVDLFELANNHVWQTEFGFRDWTLDSVRPDLQLERDERGLTEWGWIEFGFQTYYTLVNCGFRMRVTAGTASGVHPVPLGFGRVYVRLPNGFRYEDWMEGLDAGHSFVTTGPMLDLRFNGKDSGHVFKVTGGQAAVLEIVGTAHSRRPLRAMEVIVNGDIAETIQPDNQKTEHGGFQNHVQFKVSRNESFWVAVRCFEEHPEGRIRFAHTNPVYVDMEGSRVRPAKRALDFIIQQLEKEQQQLGEMLSKPAVSEYQKAIDIYRQLRLEEK